MVVWRVELESSEVGAGFVGGGGLGLVIGTVVEGLRGEVKSGPESESEELVVEEVSVGLVVTDGGLVVGAAFGGRDSLAEEDLEVGAVAEAGLVGESEAEEEVVVSSEDEGSSAVIFVLVFTVAAGGAAGAVSVDIIAPAETAGFDLESESESDSEPEIASELAGCLDVFMALLVSPFFDAFAVGIWAPAVSFSSSASLSDDVDVDEVDFALVALPDFFVFFSAGGASSISTSESLSLLLSSFSFSSSSSPSLSLPPLLLVSSASSFAAWALAFVLASLLVFFFAFVSSLSFSSLLLVSSSASS